MLLLLPLIAFVTLTHAAPSFWTDIWGLTNEVGKRKKAYEEQQKKQAVLDPKPVYRCLYDVVYPEDDPICRFIVSPDFEVTPPDDYPYAIVDLREYQSYYGDLKGSMASCEVAAQKCFDCLWQIEQTGKKLICYSQNFVKCEKVCHGIHRAIPLGTPEFSKMSNEEKYTKKYYNRIFKYTCVKPVGRKPQYFKLRTLITML